MATNAIKPWTSGVRGRMSDWGYFEKLTTDLAQKREQSGAKAYGKGQVDVGKSTDYWSKLLGGDKKEISSAIEPERSTMGKAFEAGRKSIAEFGPRGGGTSAAVAESRFQEAGELGKMVSAKREGAAEKLAEAGMAESKLGVDQMTQAETQLGDIFKNLLKAQVDYETGKQGTDWGAIASGAGKTIGTIAGLL
jgi:hypothetical protein